VILGELPRVCLCHWNLASLVRTLHANVGAQDFAHALFAKGVTAVWKNDGLAIMFVETLFAAFAC